MTDSSRPPAPLDRSRRRRPASDAAPSGRNQIIEAAITSMLEVGFYRSSTNEIARRANVSWGAVQYHFGTREALMLAVVEELDLRFASGLADAEITGDTPEERIRSLYGILRRWYDTPEVFVRLQIVLNLQHDPDTSAEVNAEIAKNAAAAEATVHKLLADAVGTGASKTAIEATFHAVRGFALSQQLSRTIHVGRRRAGSEASLSYFLRGVALAGT